ncbi:MULTISPECIES: hypothetical protein [Bradyrhizobium]|uniref:hypothetical protein n=1 Tax=Bradyrhizobium TaxID=374 RepID=UPI001008EEFA|nr:MULTISPECIES: hypothetical protein [Bradyrhizobium]MDA9400916.1 hypothetical protein [Bradyrhizobium sp. CCBAU 45389]MDA9527306.1 hypothetical protein [Bradyrhizobium sp. CCBAU 25338]RXH33308.1 hypothetical protein XH84_10040 [Bradyrhizobium nanningense]
MTDSEHPRRRPPRIVIERPPNRPQPPETSEDKAAERQHRFAIVLAALRQSLSESVGLIDAGQIATARSKLDELVRGIDAVEVMDDDPE